MLTEDFIAATTTTRKPSAHLSSALKDVGIFLYEFQPQSAFRQGFKKSTVHSGNLAISDNHVFAAQADKAVIHVYNRAKGSQEVTVPFPEKIKSIAYADKAAVLVIGTDDGKLILWETATGRISTSAASHLQSVSHLSISPNNDSIVSGSPDTSLHVWSLSHLLSFPYSISSHDDSTVSKSPLRTFSNHRSVITALTIGHSATTTNFAVSASLDQVCYIWHIQTAQILRAILLPAVPLCATLDPADRAVYLGCEDGTIQDIDLFGHSTGSSKLSIFEANHTPVQLVAADSWKATSEIGAAQCVTLSYDGTSLFSGHTSGKIVRWDVAKHRVISEIADLNQPVSCINMLTPSGLRFDRPRIALPNVVKPRLELSVQPEEGSLDVPSTYTFQSQLVESHSNIEDSDPRIRTAILEPGLPYSLLEDALKALRQGAPTSKQPQAQPSRDIATEAQNARLKEENEALKQRLKDMLRAEEEQRARHMERAKKRTALRKDRVEACSLARKNGKDGDAAMRAFDDAERSLDIESDQEHIEQVKMDIDS